MISKRRDDKGRVLQQGEWQEPSGRYRYKYTDSLGKRKILYSWRSVSYTHLTLPTIYSV